MAQRTGRSGLVIRWAIRLLVAAVAVAVLAGLGLVGVRLATAYLWFASVHDAGVYATMLEAKAALFAIFGLLAAVVGGLTIVAVRRTPARLEADAYDNPVRSGFRHYERWLWPVILVACIAVPAVQIGRRAAGHWQTALLWQHTVPWHATDPLFGKDVSFFVQVYPFYEQVLSLLSRTVVYAVGIAVIAGYFYGSWRLRGGRRRVTRGWIRLLSLLFGVYLALDAVGYWLARYAVTTSQRGPVTGASYTGVHATVPSRVALMIVAGLCAAALIANAVLPKFGVVLAGRFRSLLAPLGVMVLASAVIGSAWPSAAYQLREGPSAAKVDLTEIADNRAATMTAYGLTGVIHTVAYHPPTLSSAALLKLAHTTAQIPLIDPNQLSPSFDVNQQLQAYYNFKSTLDIDHYPVDGTSQDVAVGVRELQISGIPHNSWVNNHLVYTHGYGLVAAPTGEMDPRTESPVFLDGGMPPGRQIPITRPQIYYGQGFSTSSYAIVGRPKGSHKNLEFDHPGDNGSAKSAHTTYHGSGGIPLGSMLDRALFAVKLHSSDIMFSSEINRDSQLLIVRNPRARVARIAPWLTLDGDVYPAVVDGHIDWIVDAYTTASTYPYSQQVNLHTASKTTLTADGASVAQPNRTINYMRNSVKAVVDAYTGKVTLYSWDQAQHPDPLLHAWETVFPGLVKPQSSIPAALLAHLRYPTDLFNVQRYLLAKYHVSDPADFYSGNDFWAVPSDPTVAANQQINAGSTKGAGAPPQPSEYVTMSADGTGAPQFSLSSPMVTLNGRQLAAFIYLDAQPGPGYGRFTVLEFPADQGGESPYQVQNDIESDTKITEALTLQRGGDSKVVLGDLEPIPLGGRLLYVEPVYTQSSGGSSFPILRHVIALYGNGDPSFDNSLTPALQAAIGSGVQPAR